MGKIIITGPGRSGTSFLIQLLTRLGMDTGFEPYNEPFVKEIRAGCEWVITLNDALPEEVKRKLDAAPRVLKSCEWPFMLKNFLALGLVEIDHVIIPIRDLDEAAKSRVDAGLDWLINENADYQSKLISQANIKAMALGRAVEACLLYSLPCTIMHFPSLVKDVEYCYRKLTEVERFEREKFEEVWFELSRVDQGIMSHETS